MSPWLIETQRLQLRPLTEQDGALMLAVWNDPAFIKYVRDLGIRTERHAREVIRNGAAMMFARYGYGPYCMSLKASGELVGICGLFKRDNLDHPDIGFSVLPDYCGKGLASEAAIAVVDYARDPLGIDVLSAIVSPENAASVRLIKKLGLKFERMITMPGETQSICLYGMAL